MASLLRLLNPGCRGSVAVHLRRFSQTLLGLIVNAAEALLWTSGRDQNFFDSPACSLIKQSPEPGHLPASPMPTDSSHALRCGPRFGEGVGHADAEPVEDDKWCGHQELRGNVRPGRQHCGQDDDHQ